MPETNPDNGKQRIVGRVAFQAKTLLKIGIALFLMMILGTYFMVHTTEKPSFCATCKIMVPYYQAWETSTHNHVPCIECHYAPGIKSTVEGKFKAISQVAKYITNTAGTRPWAEIPDASCLRSECHERRLLQSRVKYGSITFDHRPHLLDLRRGKQLRCTSCHSQVVMGNHLSVTTSTCFICHFKDKSFPELWSSCLDCHPNPKKVVTVKGQKFQHGDYVARNVPCMKCHIEVVQGDGAVPRERCYSCHNEEQHVANYGNSPKIHKIHVTDHKVECFDCHLEIQHGVVETKTETLVECSTCHLGTHKAQLDMYEGRNGRLVAPHRSEMAERQVDCRACHIVNPGSPAAPFVGTTLITENIACMACHGPTYKDILSNWELALTRMLDETGKAAQAAAAARSSWTLDSGDREIAGQLLDDANFNFEFVRTAKGVHNIHYARELLNKSTAIFNVLRAPTPDSVHDLVNVKEKAGSLPPDANCTKLCHVAAPDKKIQFYDKTFPHAKHGPSHGTSCTRCHSTMKHGQTLLSPKDCDTCHHTELGAKDCYACHKNSIPATIGNFPHKRHFDNPNLPCGECHVMNAGSGNMTLARDCTSCHHGNAKASECVKCHRGSIATRRGAAFPHKNHFTKHKLACTQCHTYSSAKAKMTSTQDCMSCHHKDADAKRCIKCHSKQAALSRNSSMDYECDFCHIPAGGGRFEKPEAVCVQCHKKQIDQEKGKHATRGCTICHAGHSWSFMGRDKCAACHKHARHTKPVGDQCLECHKPHEWSGKSP